MRVIYTISLIVFCSVGLFIFYTVVTGRGETSTPIDISKYEVIGADLSSHNGKVNYMALKEYGLDFVYLKASEGGDFKDKNFVNNFKLAKEAGLAVGGYHFYRFDTSGYLQALNLLNSIDGRDVDLPLVIDIEEWGNPSGVPTEVIINEIRKMVGILEKEGYEIMLYTNKDGYERFIKKYLADFPLWLCSFREIDENIPWVLWQYTHRGILDGIEGLTDMNVWKGSREEWESKYKL